MDRLTGTGALELKEAYNAVYAQQENEIELTEEQIQEDFENWVNSLVEEGYYLSEYTWEDMYEEYLNEMGQRMTTGQETAQRRAQRPSPTAAPKPAPAAYRPAGGAMGGGRGSGSSPGGVRPSAAPYQSRFAGSRDAAFARARQLQGSPVVGQRVSSQTYSTLNQPGVQSRFIQDRRPVPTTTQRSAARPSAQTTAARSTTSSRQIQSPQPSIAQSYSMRPGAVAAAPRGVTTTAIPQSGSPVQGYQTAVAQSRPSLAQQASELRAMRQASQKRQGLTQSFDPFDVVMGHLIDEGYADTEEAALVIMANMSEEWRDEILDEGFKRMDRKKN